MTDIIVSGAGTSMANGTYVDTDIVNDRPRYYYGSLYITWTGYYWQIRGGTKILYYYSADDVATPDLCTTWEIGAYGSDPVPTVTAASSGQSLTLSCAAGSYSLTGTAATLTYTGSAQNLTLSCGVGSLALTGSNATFEVKRSYVLSCESGGLAYPNIVVSGAGTSEVNGTYVDTDIVYGRPRYYYGSLYITWSGTQWQIRSGTKLIYYYSADDVATPDLCTTWTKGGYYGSADPVPTVTAAPSITYTLTGSSASFEVKRNYTLACNAGSYTLTGSAVSFEVKRNYVLSCSAGSLTLTGSACTLSVKRNFALSCSAGSYALTGSACTLGVKRNYVLSCEASGSIYPGIIVSGGGTTAANGTYVDTDIVNDRPRYYYGLCYIAWSGTQWQIRGGTKILYYYSADDVATPDLCTTWTASGSGSLPVPTVTSSPATSYALTGSSVTLTKSLVLSCETGSYTLTGSDISFGNTKAYSLALDAGSYVLTGSGATFTVLRNYTLACGAGSYALTGTNADLLAQFHYTLACNSGSYLLTGTPVSLTSARSLACNSGAYVLTGLEADLFKRLVMPCGNGSYILTGSPATINSARTFVPGMGSYVLVGTDVGLYILTATPDCRTYTIPFEDRTLEVRCH